MIRPNQFERAVVNAYRPDNNSSDLTKFFGLDSEAYTDGAPFMFATAKCIRKGVFDKRIILPENLFETLFTPEYINGNFLIYNLKYDAGAIFRLLPLPVLRELQMYDEAIYGIYKIKYIRHKYMRISIIGKQKTHYIQFWDISQYFRMSLDDAANIYLSGKRKMKQVTKNYTRKYVARCWRSVSQYCKYDAQLTLELGEYFFDKLKMMGLPVAAIYSEASISSIWVNKNVKVFTAHKWYSVRHRLIAYACEAYHGGKFEITARGKTDVYAYDIVSAYPYEICNLREIAGARTYPSCTYQEDATYAFLRVRIDNSKGYHLPTGVPLDKSGALLIYPRGVFYATITKEEYEYMAFELQIPVEIIAGEWIKAGRVRYPFRKAFQQLYENKARYKGNYMLYKIAKILMNGYYGKMAQCIEDKKTGKIKVGADWNPIYAAIITANTRIRVTRIQNELQENCVAVHTDSVFTRTPLPRKYLRNPLSGKLGSWEKEKDCGEAILISCGQYQIGESKNKFRGIVAAKRKNGHDIEKDDWKKILKRARGASKIEYIQPPKPQSWSQVIHNNHDPKNINVFTADKKHIDFNMDKKRVWPSKTNAYKLLNNLEYSDFIDVNEFEPPKYWNKKLPYFLPKK